MGLGGEVGGEEWEVELAKSGRRGFLAGGMSGSLVPWGWLSRVSHLRVLGNWGDQSARPFSYRCTMAK